MPRLKTCALAGVRAGVLVRRPPIAPVYASGAGTLTARPVDGGAVGPGRPRLTGLTRFTRLTGSVRRMACARFAPGLRPPGRTPTGAFPMPAVARGPGVGPGPLALLGAGGAGRRGSRQVGHCGVPFTRRAVHCGSMRWACSTRLTRVAGLALRRSPSGHDGTAPLHLLACGLTVLLGNLARGLPIEVEAAGRRQQRLEVRRGGGVPVQHDGQGLAREQPRRALLDVGLDAQLDGLGRALCAKQGRKQLCQPGGALCRRQLGLGGGGGCGRGFFSTRSCCLLRRVSACGNWVHGDRFSGFHTVGRCHRVALLAGWCRARLGSGGCRRAGARRLGGDSLFGLDQGSRGGFLGHLGRVRRGGRCGIVLGGHRLAVPFQCRVSWCRTKGRDCRLVGRPRGGAVRVVFSPPCARGATHALRLRSGFASRLAPTPS